MDTPGASSSQVTLDQLPVPVSQDYLEQAQKVFRGGILIPVKRKHGTPLA